MDSPYISVQQIQLGDTVYTAPFQIPLQVLFHDISHITSLLRMFQVHQSRESLIDQQAIEEPK